MAPAIARVDGMPHLELIFLHSESADGCNARRVPAAPVSSDLKIASSVTGCTNGSPTAADAIEDEVQQGLAIRGATWKFRSDGTLNEASASQCNGGFHAWFRRLQIAHIAVSGQISSLMQSHHLDDARRYGRVVRRLDHFSNPTNRSVGGFNLIPVAVVRDIRQAIPVSGSFVGMTDAFAGMSAEVLVTS